MEIERKFLLDKLPDAHPYQTAEIYQGYISTSPEVRIRSYRVLDGKDSGHMNYKLTVKSDGSLSREEIESYISKEFFESLAHFVDANYGKLIHKIYRKYHMGDTVFECSVVDPGLEQSFIYGEIVREDFLKARASKREAGNDD